MTARDIISIIIVVASIALSSGVVINKVGNLEEKVVSKDAMNAAMTATKYALTKEMNKEHKEIRRSIARYHARGGE